MHGERRSFAKDARHADATAELLRQSPRDAQAQARPSDRSRARLIELPKILPDRVELLGLDAHARVRHVDAHALTLAAHRKRNTALIGELDRVRQQVEE